MIKKRWHYLFTQPCLAIALLLTLQNVSAQEICINSGGSADQIREATSNGYTHELWNQDARGTACMTVDAGTTFSAQWSGAFNFLARRGLAYDGSELTQDRKSVV